MALQFSMNFEAHGGDTGVDMEYHRIVRVELDYDTDIAVITMATYTNQTDRDADMKPLKFWSFLFKDSDFTGFDHAANNTQQAYNKIKAMDDTHSSSYGVDWSSAVDVI